MSTTTRGFLIILIVGLVALVIAALRDRHSRKQRAAAMSAADGYVTSEQVLADAEPRKPLAPADRTAAVTGAIRLALRLADAGLATHSDGVSLMRHPVVAICTDVIDQDRALLPLLSYAAREQRALTIAAPGFGPDALATLAANLAAGKLAVQALVPASESAPDGVSGSEANAADTSALERLVEATQANPLSLADLYSGYVPPAELGSAQQILAELDGCWVHPQQ